MVGFLATFLREEGGYDFKKSIVDSIVDLMTSIPETKETSLLHLCEFIEDCEFSELIVQVLGRCSMDALLRILIFLQNILITH